MTLIAIVIGALNTVTKGSIMGLKDLEIRDHTNDSMILISQNTEKSPGNLRRLVVTQTPVEDHQLMIVGKTLKGVIIIRILKKARSCLTETSKQRSLFFFYSNGLRIMTLQSSQN